MKNSELLTNIISTLEDNHINLYHDISKEQLNKYIANLKNIDSCDNKKFDLEMLKLFHLFKDAHTSYFIPFKSLDQKLFYFDNKCYISIDDVYHEVKSIGGISIPALSNTLTSLANYETNEWAMVVVNRLMRNGYTYEMLGCYDNGIDIVYDTGKVVATITDNLQVKSQCPYSVHNDGKIAIIKYKSCSEYKKYPISQFTEDVKKTIEDNNCTRYILDVRNNTGGNSELLNPIQQYIMDKNMSGVVLINPSVFSSGRFAVARFKQYCHATIMGYSGTGGAAKSYGYNKNLQVEDKQFSCSIRLWDFSDIFGTTGSIQPDIKIPVTIDDFNHKRDVVLDEAINYLQMEIKNESTNCNQESCKN